MNQTPLTQFIEWQLQLRQNIINSNRINDYSRSAFFREFGIIGVHAVRQSGSTTFAKEIFNPETDILITHNHMCVKEFKNHFKNKNFPAFSIGDAKTNDTISKLLNTAQKEIKDVLVDIKSIKNLNIDSFEKYQKYETITPNWMTAIINDLEKLNNKLSVKSTNVLKNKIRGFNLQRVVIDLGSMYHTYSFIIDDFLNELADYVESINPNLVVIIV